MDQGWFRARWVALTAVVLAVLAVGGQFAEAEALANVQPLYPEPAISIGPENDELVVLGWRAGQMLLATVALGFGIAATLKKPGRILGAVAGVIAVVVLVV